MIFNRLCLLNLTELYVEDLNDYENFKKERHVSASSSCLIDYFRTEKLAKYYNIITDNITYCNNNKCILKLNSISL